MYGLRSTALELYDQLGKLTNGVALILGEGHVNASYRAQQLRVAIMSHGWCSSGLTVRPTPSYTTHGHDRKAQE